MQVTPRDVQPTGDTTQWYAAYVKHQHEKKAAAHLQRKGVDVFLPEQKVSRVWKDRKKLLSLPLFPGYLFLRSDLRDRIEILNTPGIFFLVENAGRSCPIPDHEIDAIRRVANSGLPAREHPFITAGDRVRVRSGPLAGVVGILSYVKNQYRMVLRVELLRKALSVEVEVANVDRDDDSYLGHSLTAPSKRRA